MARRLRAPPEKKRLSLTRDHPLSAKYPKAFRKKWPCMKAHATRAQRHAQRTALEANPDDDVPVRRATVRKWPQPSLGEVIESKRARRTQQPRKSLAARARRRTRRGRHKKT
jgi:hypothetical protein